MAQRSQNKSLDDYFHEDYDQKNKNLYYQTVFPHLSGSNAVEAENQKENNFYYLAEILNSHKSNQFFEELVRDVCPNMKIKAQPKNLLKIVCKVFLQELAENCFEIIEENHQKGDIEPEVIREAFKRVNEAKDRNNNVKNLLG